MCQDRKCKRRLISGDGINHDFLCHRGLLMQQLLMYLDNIYLKEVHLIFQGWSGCGNHKCVILGAALLLLLGFLKITLGC